MLKSQKTHYYRKFPYNCYYCPTKPWAVLNRFIGLLPSVIINPCNPKPSNNLAYISGPALAISTIVF